MCAVYSVIMLSVLTVLHVELQCLELAPKLFTLHFTMKCCSDNKSEFSGVRIVYYTML